MAKTDLLIKETENRKRVSQEVQRVIATQALPLIIAGDFNMPVESTIYRRLWGAYVNAFSITGYGYGWSEKAPVRGIPIAVRIDHVLTGKGQTQFLCEVSVPSIFR